MALLPGHSVSHGSMTGNFCVRACVLALSIVLLVASGQAILAFSAAAADLPASEQFEASELSDTAADGSARLVSVYGPVLLGNRYDRTFGMAMQQAAARAFEEMEGDVALTDAPDDPAGIEEPYDPAISLSLDDEPVDFSACVEELFQSDYPAGCESVALTCILNAMGYDVDAGTIIDGYLPVDSDAVDFVHQFAGDVYAFGGAYPPVMVEVANSYLDDQGSAYGFSDASGCSFFDLLAKVEKGYPALVWTTGGMVDDPMYTDEVIDDYTWYDNEHCVVLYGNDGDTVLIMDPTDGFVEVDEGLFARLFEECGSMCAVPVLKAV